MKHNWKTRLLALMLVFCMMFGVNISAQASSIADGSQTCTIGLAEVHNYLSTATGTSLRGRAFEYKTNDGITGPAYCIDHGLDWTPAKLPIVGKYSTSPATAGAFANGYPQHTLQTFLELNLADNPILSALTEDEFGYATQVAVWASLGQLAIEGTRFTKGRERINQPVGDAQQMRVFRAVQLILGAASFWDRIYQTGMYIRLDENALGGNTAIPGHMTLEYAADQNQYGLKCEVINGKSYYTKEYIFASATSTYYNDYAMELWATGCPAGTMFTDLQNVELPRSKWHDTDTWRLPVEYRYTSLNSNGSEFSGHAKLCIPVDTAPNSGEITLHCAAQIMQYEIYLAENTKTTEQSYIIADPSKGSLDADAVLSWGSELTEFGTLEILKVGGGGLPLSGATFTLTGTDGTTRTGTTDSKGIIRWERLDPAVTYTLTETAAPAGYGIISPLTVRVTAAHIKYLTVRDDPQHTITVHKQDKQNGYSLQGAVIRFEQIDGGFHSTAVTDHAGNIQLNADQLPIGSYNVYEVAAPEGYRLDKTAQTIHWDGTRDMTLTFQNVRQSTLILSKKDSRTKYNLPGATFEVYRNGQLVTAVTTNEAGLAYVHDVAPGYYEVKETIPPDGYTLNAKTYGINIDPYDPATTDDPRLVVENDPMPSLRIVKYDSQTGKPLADTTFKVYCDTVLLGTYTTDRYGEILLTDLEPGTYTVEETAAPDSHVVNSTPQQIELTTGGDTVPTLVFFNTLKPGIHLVKVDSETLKPLPNATYRVSKVGGTFSKEYVTNKDGEIDLSKLDTGAYTVKEVTAPDGYLVDDGIRTIQLNAGQNANFVFTDTPKPSLTAVKYDPIQNKYLAGATFHIAKVEDGSHYLDRVTDTQGRITISNLEPGVYSVQETAAPSGYVLNSTEYHVELFPGRDSELVVTNEAMPDLKIVKTDAITGEPVQGVTFTVKQADGRTLTTEATNEQGEIFLADMEPGVVEIWEQSVPSSYLLNEEHQLITLVPNKLATVRFQNYPRPGLLVNKVDAITGDPIQGAKFHVTYASNNTFTGEVNDLGNFLTDEKGQFSLNDLQDGWYRVEEVEPAKGYAIKDPAAQEVYIKAGTHKELTYQNTPLSALVVYKYDGQTGEAVRNAVFQVKYLSGTSGSGGTIIGTYKTSANGSFTVTGLQAGTYIVEELASDSGHVIDTAPQTAYISGKEQDVVQLYFGNSPKGALLVKKVDAATGKPLSDVEFMVTDSAGAVVGTANGKYTTDSSGSFTVSNITPGTTLVVKETRAKAGYILDGAPQTAQVKAGQTVTLEFRNMPTGALVIVKRDKVTNKPLAGATFKVTTSSGAFVAAQGGTVSSNGLYTTDKEGQIVLSVLEPDTYVVTETKAPKGYKLDADPQTVRVNANDTQTLYFYDTPTPEGSLRIVKLDEASRQPIAGVEFLVTHMDGKRLGTYRTNSRGIITLDELTPGWYTVTETKAAEGYKLDAQPHDVQVKDGKTATVELTNRQSGSALIHKIDAVTGKGIFGVTFLVSDSRGNPVGQYTSDNEGYVYIDGDLADGKYTIREIQQAEGYIMDATPKTVYIEYGGCSTVVWKNTPIRGQLQVVKRSADYNPINGLPAGTLLEGATFEVYNERTGSKVDTIVSGANGLAVSQQLPLGRYVIREVKAPAHYMVNDTPMTAVLEYSGQIIRFEVTNQSAATGVAITKTGPKEAVSGQPVRYVFSGIANTGNVTLDSFYWRDSLPAAVTLDKVVTGSYNRPGTYKVVYKVNNAGDYRTLADNLSTAKSYTLDARPATLGLAANERITEIMFVFGQAPAGFAQVEAPMLYCIAVNGLGAGSSIVNTADVGGVYNGAWVQAVTRWTTSVYGKPTPLPRTGY